MAVFVSRKKQKLSKKLRDDEIGLFCSFLGKIFQRLPSAIFILAFIYIWSSSATLFSGNIVHLCVSSRKLNNLYCLSAGAQPNLDIPVALVNYTSPEGEAASSGIGSSVPSDNVKESNPFGSKNATLAVNGTMGYAHGKVVSSAEDANSFDSKNATLAVNGTVGYAHGEAVSSAEDANSFDSKNVTLAVNGTMGYSYKEVAETNFHVRPVALVNRSSSVDEEVVDFGIRSLNSTDTEGHFDRDVEKQIRLQRSWTSGSNAATCDGRGIYVYELPSKFNKDLAAQCKDMLPWEDLCKYFTNGGLGERIENLGAGWYNTHQYALEPIFHARVLKHPCRVYDRKEARLFYVPYYGGLDVLRWHFKNVSADVKDSLGVDLVRWLETQESWYLNLAKDHVFVLGKISWDFRRKDRNVWGTRFLELDEMQNPVKLLIERHPWHINDIGVPHPTYFHPHSDEEIVSWQLKTSGSSRKNVVGFAGAARPGSTESIRSILIEQCTSANSGDCRFMDCATERCNRPESIIELFTESEFCLQPIGDSPTRKSFFDSLISGCIPVLFSPFTAYYQYPWHLPEDREKYSVFIDEEEVRNKSVNVVERLMKIPAREREGMRRYIVYELLPGLVYGDLDSKFDKFRDAFSITIDSLLERVSRSNDG